MLCFNAQLERTWVSDYDHECVHNNTTYSLSESESPSTSCVSMQKKHGSQIMITSVYIIAQLTS